MRSCKIIEPLLAAARRLRSTGETWADHLVAGCGQQSSALRALTEVTDQADRTGAHTFGGIPADTPLGEWPSLAARLDDSRGGQSFYADLREYVTQHEMPADMRTELLSHREELEWAETDEIGTEPSDGAKWLASRTWGRAVQIKQEHLRREGVTGRDYAQALWEWKAGLEEEARRMREPLPFSPEIAGKEPYLGEVYRADRRTRETIAEEGMRPWSDKRDEGWIIPHDDRAGDRGDTSDLIWTSKDPEIAARYADEHEPRVYVLQDALGSLDMNNKYGTEYEVYDAHEVVFRDGIPSDKVKGELVDPGDLSAGIIPHTGFVPHEPTPIRPPREDGD